MPFIQFMLALGLLAGLIWLLWLKTAARTGWNKIFWTALCFKLLCGMLLGVFYRGSGDTFVYHNYAAQIHAFAQQDLPEYLNYLFRNELPPDVFVEFKPYSNSYFFVKLLSLLHFITGRHYYLNGLFLSLFSFAGCWAFTRAVAKTFPGTGKAAIIGFLFFPSVVFWNAGVMKEPLLMGALCFFWALVLKTVCFQAKKPALNFALILFFSWLLWKVKLFLAVIVFGLTLTWLFLKWLRKRVVFLQPKRNFTAFLLVFLTFITVGSGIFLQKFADAFFYRHLVRNYETLQKLSAGKPIIVLEDLKPELGSILINLPEALFGVFIRPFIWEGDNWFYRFAGSENIILVLLFLGSLSALKDFKKWRLPGFYVLLIAFIFIMAALTGLTTPNLGTMNRYRTVFLPFLVFLLLQAPFWQGLLNRFELKLKQQKG